VQRIFVNVSIGYLVDKS